MKVEPEIVLKDEHAYALVRMSADAEEKRDCDKGSTQASFRIVYLPSRTGDNCWRCWQRFLTPPSGGKLERFHGIGVELWNR